MAPYGTLSDTEVCLISQLPFDGKTRMGAMVSAKEAVGVAENLSDDVNSVACRAFETVKDC